MQKGDAFRKHDPWNLLRLCGLQQWNLFCLKETDLHQGIISLKIKKKKKKNRQKSHENVRIVINSFQKEKGSNAITCILRTVSPALVELTC